MSGLKPQTWVNVARRRQGEMYVLAILFIALITFMPHPANNSTFLLLLVATFPLSLFAYPASLWGAFVIFGHDPVGVGLAGRIFVVFLWVTCAWIQMSIIRWILRMRRLRNAISYDAKRPH